MTKYSLVPRELDGILRYEFLIPNRLRLKKVFISSQLLGTLLSEQAFFCGMKDAWVQGNTFIYLSQSPA